MSDVAYLDHAATTPVRPEALEAMLPLLSTTYGNPSGSHRVARAARRALDEAREVVADVVGGNPGEVVFTATGTEADNLAVAGVVRARGGTAVCTATEHHAVLDPVVALGGRVAAVDAAGAVDLGALADALDPSVAVVSVMLVNNEVGTVTDLAAVAEVVRARAPQALLHTDAVQAFPWLDLREAAAPADLVSISGHKFGAPKGVGALLVRAGVDLQPLVLGGGQERGRRSGTQAVASIAAMAAAARACDEERKAVGERVGALRDRFVDALLALGGVVETVPRARKVPGSAHVCVEGVESEALLFLLDQGGVCASAASACASGAQVASHVLAAMGVPAALAGGAVRFSLGATTTPDEVDHALGVVAGALGRLRR